MIRIYLLLTLLGLIFFAWPKFFSAVSRSLKNTIKNNGLLLIVGLLLFLTMTGKLNAFFVACGVILTVLARSLPFFLRHFPPFQSLWTMFTTAQAANGQLSVEEAYKILGLPRNATEQDIILAHKRLMQKLHPDRGGSDYLASQINLAKAVLLKKSF